MKPRIVLALCAGVALATFAACNAPNGDDLFGEPYPQTANGGGTSTGGAVVSGGRTSTGGATVGGMGGVVASGGGGIIGNGGHPGPGGIPNTGGLTENSGGAGGSENFDVADCNFTGAWASYVTIPTTWQKTLVLLEGKGTIEQWGLTLQEQTPGSPVVKARTFTCGITLPDLESAFFGQKTKFGIRFPDQLFDRGILPNAAYEMRAVPTAAGPELVSNPFALLAGAKMADPVNDKWPTVTDMTLSDDDKDGDVGIRVVSATGPGYSVPPSNIFGELAPFIDIAERTVHRYHGAVASCDEFEAELEILTVAGKPAIDSTVVGCVKENGGKCTPGDAQFIDSNRSQFVPRDTGKLRTHRIPNGSKCEDVRAFYANSRGQ